MSTNIQKKTPEQFIAFDFYVYLSQIFIFFMVAVFTSDFLSNDKKLIDYMNTKINHHFTSEVGLTLLAIFVTIGIFSMVGRVLQSSSPNSTFAKMTNVIIDEAPRAIYFFGASVSGAMFAAGVFLVNHPEVDTSVSALGFFIVTIAFAAIIFLAGCALNFALNYKTHIIPPQKIAPTTTAHS